MQSQLPFMETVGEYAFVEAPKGALCLTKTGMKDVEKQGEAFFDTLQDMTGEEPPVSDPGSIAPHMDRAGGTIKPVVMRVFEEIENDAMGAQGQPAVETIDATPGSHLQVAGPTEFMADEGLEGGRGSETPVEAEENPGSKTTPKTDGRTVAPPATNTSADPGHTETGKAAGGAGHTETGKAAGGAGNSEAVNAASRQPVEMEEKQGQTSPLGWPTHGPTQHRQGAAPVSASLSDREETSGPMTVSQGSNSGPITVSQGSNSGPITVSQGSNSGPMTVSQGSNSGPMTVNQGSNSAPMTVNQGSNSAPMTVNQGSNSAHDENGKDAISANPQPLDGQPGKGSFSFSSEGADNPAPRGGGPDPRSVNPIKVPNDAARVSHEHLSSGESGNNREGTPATSNVSNNGPGEGGRFHAMPWSSRDMVDHGKKTQAAPRSPDEDSKAMQSAGGRSVEQPDTIGRVAAEQRPRAESAEHIRRGGSIPEPSVTGENKTGPDNLTQQSLNGATATRRPAVPASAPPVAGESKNNAFVPATAGSTTPSDDMKSETGPVTAQSAVGRESTGRIPFSSLPAGETDGAGNGAKINTPPFAQEKIGGRTITASPDAPKGMSSDDTARGSDSKNETGNNGQNGQGLFQRYGLESSGSAAGREGPGHSALFSPGEVATGNGTGGESILPEGPNPQEGTAATHSPAAGKSEQTALHANPAQARPGAEVPDFFPKIVDRVVMTLKGGQSEMKMVLKPEFLGQVRMQVSTENQHVMIKIVAETQVVKETIESNLAQLKAGLQSHGLEVDEFDVTTSQDSHRDEQNPRHLPGYRLGSKASGRTAQNAPEGEAEKQVPTQTITDGSGKVDFFA